MKMLEYYLIIYLESYPLKLRENFKLQSLYC